MRESRENWRLNKQLETNKQTNHNVLVCKLFFVYYSHCIVVLLLPLSKLFCFIFLFISCRTHLLLLLDTLFHRPPTSPRPQLLVFDTATT